ncbi:Transcription factor CBF/NF-Y/archaeal histone domain and Histone-fold domain-containing protein [Strongyloides ratti]|uniref:DNA polymerase epsilon subunit 3 n=1 Tax=Strongyloides ratti TaxID=34506 RepID=A0A090N048_STRRB|nr:Transcription factor CBF/NF-Y/archaeal histone domain and Histone-fold domain-containing protein [Strongyloides ratti]CEF70060.1 Transcription factor CBF/NF-Y/archaeal histone domain and Histone-fold domain-containing protein [Strongyloides ratti]
MADTYQESLPMSQILKVIKKKAPKGAQFSKDFKSAMSKSAQIFIYYLTATAQEIATKNKRKKIMIEDLRKAVVALELDPLNAAVNEVINLMTSQVRVPAEESKDSGDGEKEDSSEKIPGYVDEKEIADNESESVVMED